MTPKENTKSRREFLQGSATVLAGLSVPATVLAGPAIARSLGANEKLRMGFIGVGNRGSQLLTGFLAEPDVEVVALCDIYEPYLMRDRAKVDPRIVDSLKGANIPAMEDTLPGKVERYRDFRRLLENRSIDAVCIATPDHWHALQMIAAVDAGKHVYVEKPLTNTIAEGRKMVEAARRTGRIVQVGLNRRASGVYREAVGLVQSGKLGKVSFARAYRINNMAPHGIGRMPPSDPPAGFDWDMWLGPRAKRPYQFNIAPYKFRWWKDYSTQMGNWGVHKMDAIRWLIGEEAPLSISAHGTHKTLDDDRTIPDTMEATFEFASGAIATFGIYEASGTDALASGEVEIRGTLGNLYIDDRGYSITTDKPGQFQESGSKLQPVKVSKGREDVTQGLIHNFVDAVRSGKPLYCDLETGHRSTCFAHLANIALETGSRLSWDAKAERFKGNEAANRLLHYQYRPPWKL